MNKRSTSQKLPHIKESYLHSNSVFDRVLFIAFKSVVSVYKFVCAKNKQEEFAFSG